MKGKILSVTTDNGELTYVGEEIDGFTVENISFRRDGHIGVNRYMPDESHFLVTLTSEMSDKDKKYIVLPASYRSIIFEEDKPKQEPEEVVMENMG